MAGAIKTLFGALQASTYLTGVSLVFGEENVNAQDSPLPMIIMVPVGGEINNTPGYAGGLDPAVEMIWGIREQVDFYLWAYDTTPGAQPIDHADAVETLRQKLLSALRDQQAQYADVASVSYGLSWYPVSERWSLYDGASVRYGRCLIVSTRPEIAVAMATPQEATITSFSLIETINNNPPG